MKLALVFVLVAAPAFAKGGTPQNHHCVGKDGAEVAGVTKKACKKAGGKWEKMKKTGAGTGETTTPSGAEQPK